MKKYIFILLLSTCLFGCKKQLNEQVFSELTSTIYYNNAGDATTALYGVYNSLNRTPFSDWDTDLYSLVHLPSKYVISRVPFRKVFSNFTYGASDPAIERVWQRAYITINRANAVIDNVPSINMDDNLKKQIVSEAKFLRALTYFNLVRLFGGVPLRIRETTSLDEVNLARSTAQQVYDLIISDLKEGEANMPDKRPVSEKGRATNGSASGLLGRVYLTMAGSPLNQADKWTLARDKFKYIIDNKTKWGYDLMTNFKDVFSLQFENNKEVLFAIQNSHVTDQGSVLAFFSAPPNSTFATAAGQYHYGFTTAFRNLYDALDKRRDVTVVYSYVALNGSTITYGAPGVPYGYKDPNGMALGKFQDGTGASTNVNHANDVLVLRYADILLMFAEAENEVNGPVLAAFTAINELRLRANATPISGLNKATFRDAVYNERLLELSGELTEFFDIQRLGKLQETISNSSEAITAGTTYNVKFALYPLPLKEVNANPLIGQANQNPGW